MDKKKSIFLTGGTGLVGSYLLGFLLKEGHKVYALTRSKGDQKAKDRIKSALEFWDKNNIDGLTSNLIVMEGDITKKDLGISRESLELLAEEIKAIFHCAALTKFNASLEESRAVNVEGTKNVLDVALLFSGKGAFEKVNHISTIYVRGNSEKILKENDLNIGQGFSTAYEESKFEAENLVNQYRKAGLDIDIFRLGAIVGETTTGKVTKFENVYQVLHVWSSGLLDFYHIPKGKLKLTPVNIAILMMYSLFEDSGNKNSNYHLIPYSLTIHKFFRYAQEYIGFKQLVVEKEKKLNEDNLSYAQKALLQKMNFFNSFATGKVSNMLTIKRLKKVGFELPDFDKTNLCKIFQYAIDRNIIKKNMSI